MHLLEISLDVQQCCVPEILAVYLGVVSFIFCLKKLIVDRNSLQIVITRIKIWRCRRLQTVKMSEKTSLNCEAGCCSAENMTDLCKVALTMKFLIASYCDMLRSGK